MPEWAFFGDETPPNQGSNRARSSSLTIYNLALVPLKVWTPLALGAGSVSGGFFVASYCEAEQQRRQPGVMYSDLSRKGCGVEFTYAVHIAKTAEVHILARYV